MAAGAVEAGKPPWEAVVEVAEAWIQRKRTIQAAEEEAGAVREGPVDAYRPQNRPAWELLVEEGEAVCYPLPQRRWIDGTRSGAPVAEAYPPCLPMSGWPGRAEAGEHQV